MRSAARGWLLALTLLVRAAVAHLVPPADRLTRSAQHAALTLLRFPFTVVKTAVSAVWLLPKLPSLARENATLKMELARRQLEVAGLREQLRQAQRPAAFVSTPQATGLVAEVIGRSTIPTQQLILVNKGRRDGLTLDHVVVDAVGVVGRVTELTPSTALVALVTDPESRIASLVERSREAGLMVGRGRGQCELIYVDVDADIRIGDQVITAGLGGAFPKGLRLGVVTNVRRDAAAGAASAWVKPSARIGRLEEVLCVAPNPEPRTPNQR